MRSVEQNLNNWGSSLLDKVELGSLRSRNPISHKWKAGFRSLMLREVVAWRAHDLLTQSLLLYDAGNCLGARILLRKSLRGSYTIGTIGTVGSFFSLVVSPSE